MREDAAKASRIHDHSETTKAPVSMPIPESWYLDSFGDEYLRIYRQRDAESARREVEFLLDRFDLVAGTRVLDLCCGAGRHLGPLLDRGCRAVGLDRSLPLVREARERLGGGVLLVLGC